MLIFGGNNSKGWVERLDVLIPSTSQWKKVSDMPKKGNYWAAAALPGHIYLMGGAGKQPILSENCLRYDFPTNDWFEASPLSSFLTLRDFAPLRMITIS